VLAPCRTNRATSFSQCQQNIWTLTDHCRHATFGSSLVLFSWLPPCGFAGTNPVLNRVTAAHNAFTLDDREDLMARSRMATNAPAGFEPKNHDTRCVSSERRHGEFTAIESLLAITSLTAAINNLQTEV
jgi:hypothetical protein